jgi:hypothetical protein
MSCLVCGANETIRSHIIPRSLFRLTKGDRKLVARTRRGDTGWDVSQSGFYDDDILCSEHEERLGPFDDYAARFCRTFMAKAANGAMSVAVRNGRPDLLVGFACAVVWRWAASRSPTGPDDLLGPSAFAIRDLLFGDVPFDPLLLLSRNAFHISGERLEMNVLPVRHVELDRQFWRFITCGIIFDLKLDERPTPPEMAVLAANAQQEVHLFEDFPQDALRVPGLRAALIRFSLPKRPHSRKG